MARDFITVVAGFPRSGTSLLMGLLGAAGVPVLADDPGHGWEYAPTARLPRDAGWLPGAVGRAFKLLDPHRCTLPAGLPYRVVWLDRMPMEQARSQLKFVRLRMGSAVRCGDRAERAISQSLLRDRPAAMAALRAVTPDVLAVRFEDLIERPAATCAVVAAHLRLGADPATLAARVDRRPATCLPYLREVHGAPTAR